MCQNSLLMAWQLAVVRVIFNNSIGMNFHSTVSGKNVGASVRKIEINLRNKNGIQCQFLTNFILEIVESGNFKTFFCKNFPFFKVFDIVTNSWLFWKIAKKKFIRYLQFQAQKRRFLAERLKPDRQVTQSTIKVFIMTNRNFNRNRDSD